MRSLLYTPGHRASMVARVLDGGLPTTPDVALLDLEDGVPPAERENARRVLAEAIVPARGRCLRFVRIGRSTSDDSEADLAAVVRHGLDGVVVPKVGRAEELDMVDDMLRERERAAGMRERTVRVIAAIETAAGLIDAPRIARAPRLVGLMFGSEDFASDLGLATRREGEAVALTYARSAIVVAAGAARILAFDGIWPDFHDEAGLRADAVRGRQLGFAGRQCIHPDQVAVVNEIFSPTADEVEHARRVVDAFEDGIGRGLGAVAVVGEMLDAPIVARARRVLRVAGG
jgi:citrate lyase subunit beta/citryl-CoA lyase